MHYTDQNNRINAVLPLSFPFFSFRASERTPMMYITPFHFRTYQMNTRKIVNLFHSRYLDAMQCCTISFNAMQRNNAPIPQRRPQSLTCNQDSRTYKHKLKLKHRYKRNKQKDIHLPSHPNAHTHAYANNIPYHTISYHSHAISIPHLIIFIIPVPQNLFLEEFFFFLMSLPSPRCRLN